MFRVIVSPSEDNAPTWPPLFLELLVLCLSQCPVAPSSGTSTPRWWRQETSVTPKGKKLYNVIHSPQPLAPSTA